MHNKYTKILVILLGLPLSLFCQSNHGFTFDNYSGIYGVISNPANSVDSKYNIHVNVLSYNQLGVSDIGNVPYLNVETAPNGFNGLEFEENLMNVEDSGYSFGHTDVLLPSVVWNFHEKYAVGLLLRSRSFFDYNDVDSDLLQSANKGFGEDDFSFDNANLNNTAHSWTEIGLNLSAVLLNSNYHFVKFGGTFKYLMGTGGNEFTGSLNGNYPGGNSDLTINGSLTSLNTFDLPANNEDSTSKSFVGSSFFKQNGKGFSGDLGFVYEWRPRETNRVDVRSNSSSVNKYKLKISASVLDFGSIDYKSEPAKRIRRNTISLSNVIIPNNAVKEENSLISALNDPENITPKQGDVTFALPRSFNLNLDYIILNNKNYYININYIKGLTKATDEYEYTNTQMSLITVTPRYETRKFSVYLPVSFDYESTGSISAGLGVRYGPVTIGAAALSSMFMDGKMRHLYFGLSIPLMKDLYR